MKKTEAKPTPAKKQRKKLKVTDIILLVAFAAVVVVLAKTLMSDLGIHNKLNAAKTLSDQALTDIQKQDAAKLYALGDSTFKSDNTQPQLQSLLKIVHPYVGGTPVVTKRTVLKDTEGDAVSIIYKFTSKKDYYLRVTADKPHGSDKWQLNNLLGNADQAKVLPQ